MTDSENPRAVMGGNFPPPFDPSIFAACETKVADFMDAAREWLALEAIKTVEQSGRLTDFVSGARDAYKQIDQARKDAKKPHDEAGKAVQAAFSPLLEKIERAMDRVKALQNDYLRRVAEEERAARAKAAAEAAEKQRAAEEAAKAAAASNDIAAEVEAERMAKEAEEAAKAAARETRANAGSATGAGRTMALRKIRRAEIVNQNQVYMHFRDHPGLKAYLLQLCNQAITSKNADERNVPGIRVFEEEKAA